MSGIDRRTFETATVLDQDFLDYQHSVMLNKIEMIAEIETPTGIIYVSDRDKYVGSTFYRARVNFPTIKRTVGEILSPSLAFSTINLDIANADGEYNNLLPAGANFDSWVGKAVTIKMGLAEVASTYKVIFAGKITEAGGFGRDNKVIKILARDNNDDINKTFPVNVFNQADYPHLSNDDIGLGVPVIYGDWSTNLDPLPAVVPTTIVNKLDPFIQPEEKREVEITIASPGVCTIQQHHFVDDDEIKIETDGVLPSGLSAGNKYFVIFIDEDSFALSATAGGLAINTGGVQSGSHLLNPYDETSFTKLDLVISDNDNQAFDQDNVYLRRSDLFYKVPNAAVGSVTNNSRFKITQFSTNWVGADQYKYKDGDEFFVHVTGKRLVSGIYSTNSVEIARDILETYGDLAPASFHSNWDTFRSKSTPLQSAIVDMPCRAWIQESQNVLEYSLSILEQVRLEAFFDRDQKFKILSNHYDDWDDAPVYEVLNWDVVKDSFSPNISDRTEVNFNRGQAIFNYFPIRNENANTTEIYKNTSAVTQLGKEVTKTLLFPNLPVRSDVVNQFKEVIKFTSTTIEYLEYSATWRSMLLEIGDFIAVNVTIGSVTFESVPAMIREIGYNPKGVSIPIKCVGLQLFPFGTWNPGYQGIVSGQNKVIDKEI